MKKAKGHFEINIDGNKIEMDYNGDSAAFLVATSNMIRGFAQATGATEESALRAIIYYLNNSRTFAAESKEQLDVIEEILKSRTDK